MRTPTGSDTSKMIDATQFKGINSLGIRGRLLLGFGSITVIFLISIMFTLYYVTSIKNYSNQVNMTELPTYDQFLDLNSEIYQNQVKILEWIIRDDPKVKSELKSNWESILQTQMNIDEMKKNWGNESYIKYWQDIKTALGQLKEVQDQLIEFSTADKSVLLNKLAELNPLYNQLETLLNTLNVNDRKAEGILDIQSEALHNGTDKILNNLDVLQVAEFILFIAGLILSILIALFTIKVISRHISVFRTHSSRIASGDLTKYVPVETNDEMGKLGDDLNKMTESLSTMTRQITDACHNMVISLEEVRHAIDAQSSGSSQQASSINEITASISEIEKSSNQTMEKAKTLGEVAERTREKGQMGLEAVEQSVVGMKSVRDKVQMIAQTILDLSNQTQQVGEITAAVNNLAQQSKMLALNASIEAAKAGEAGKGFAVVAVEVKNLAEQSEQSTAQVQKILEDIRHATEKAVMVTEEGTKGVDHGTTLVEQTGEIIRSLNDVIHEATIASQQIAAAVRQEGAGIEQITTGMNEINQVTSAFVESVHQTKEAMSNLADIAKNLKSYVDTYKI